MKKFSIKSLLVLVLALILVFSLVACNDDKGNDDDNNDKDTITVADYFSKLWDLSTNMGNKKIESTQNVGVTLDLGVELQVKKGNQTSADLAIGVAVDAVLDRQHVEGDNIGVDTAFKVQLYNMATDDNWMTIYYFMGDAGKVYIDYAGQNVVVPFDYMNDQHSEGFSNLVFGKKFLQKTDEKTGEVKFEGYSIGQLISMFTDKMGESWNLNSLINDVLALVETAMDQDAGYLSGMVGGLLEGLGVDPSTLYDANGNIDLSKALANKDIASLLFDGRGGVSKSKVNDDGTTVYTARLGDTVSTFLGMIPMVGDLLSSNGNSVAIEYTEKNNELDNVAIVLNLGSLKSATLQYPVVKVAINSIEFRGVNAGQSADFLDMPVAKDNYTTDVALDLNLTLDLDGITINPSAFATGNHPNDKLANIGAIALDGQLVVNVNGKLDIANAKENNTTAATAVISYQASGEEEAVPFATASFVKDTVAVTINQDLKVKVATGENTSTDVSVAQMLVGGFGGYVFDAIGTNFSQTEMNKFAEAMFTKDVDGKYNKFSLNPNFKGAVWTNIDVKGGVNSGIEFVVDKIVGLFNKDAKSTADANADDVTIIDKVCNTIVKVIGLVSTTDDTLTINVDNINEVVANVGVDYDPAMTETGNIQSIITMDKDNWLDDFVNFFTINDLKVTDKADFLTQLMASSAKVVLGLNGTDGLSLNVDVDIMKQPTDPKGTAERVAGVKVSLTLALEDASGKTYTNLAEGVTAETAGWYYCAF